MSRRNSRVRILDAALALIARRGGADVSMAEIARAAHVSRQAVYLHFGDRGALLVALVRHADEQRGIADEIRKIAEAPGGVEAMREMVALQARANPRIWALAKALDAVRRGDKAVERSWQDRLRHRLEGCHAIVTRLQEEHVLRPGLDPDTAADLLWTMTSLRMWEDLVLERGWTAERYETHVGECVLASLVAGPIGHHVRRDAAGTAVAHRSSAHS